MMEVEVWIVLRPGGDRPYISTTRPTEERYKLLKQDGCSVFKAVIMVPGWKSEDGVTKAVAHTDSSLEES